MWPCMRSSTRQAADGCTSCHRSRHNPPCPLDCRLQDVGPHTWSVLTAGYPLESTSLPFYAQQPSHVAATKGLEPPLRIR